MWGMEFTENKKVRSKILKKLHKDIFLDRGVRLRRDSIPNFPECDLFAVLLDMEKEDTNKINSIYDEMERELKQLDNLQKLNNHNRLVVELRHRQRIELVKVPLFIDMIEEAKEDGFSIAVFVNFTETINAISKRLGINCIFDGKTADKVRDENVNRFQDNEEPVILVNVQSGGGGLSLHDLYGGHPRLALISPSHSPVNMRQVVGRIWRDDAKTKGIQKLVCVANSVEENVYYSVIGKLNNLDLLTMEIYV
jgi:superfamily II DNA or RNA helicase